MRLGTNKRTAFLLCSVAFVIFTTPAHARPAHKAAHRQHAAQIAVQPQAARSPDGQPYPLTGAQPAVREASHGHRRVAQAHTEPALGGFTSSDIVSEARKYIGTNPTGRGSLWCGAFMDLVLKRTGHAGGGNLASAYSRYGTRVSGPQVGAIAVMGRSGGGHVGVVTGLDASGNPIVLSGNTWSRATGGRHTVAEQVIPRGRIYAYVMPGN